MLLSQPIGSIRAQGAPALPLHADNNWIPAPFPAWDVMLTACLACDDFTRVGGATKVVPASNRHNRHPKAEEIAAEKGAIAIECPAGSIALWNAAVWHGNYPREIEGDRVVLHMTYTRLSFRPVEDYRHLDDEWLASRPPELATLLGRDDFLQHRRMAEGFADPKRLGPVFASVQGHHSIPRKR
jgi:ectoine hydroxylase-related dioxygenase (phytanoyl-CoA dioxygenase family)